MELKVQNPLLYVKAVNGIFNLTDKEMDYVVAIMEVGADYKKVASKLGATNQVSANYMTMLRKKKALNKNELHKIYKLKNIKICLL